MTHLVVHVIELLILKILPVVDLKTGVSFNTAQVTQFFLCVLKQPTTPSCLVIFDLTRIVFKLGGCLYITFGGLSICLRKIGDNCKI